MAIKIGTTTYSFLRDAINRAVSGDTILVEAGTYNIATSPNGTSVGPNDVKFYNNINNNNVNSFSLSRFYSSQSGINNLTITGSGASSSTISNLTRIYTASKDRAFGLPSNWTIKNLTLNFNLPFTGSGSGDYILQGGEFPVGNGSGALLNLTLQNLKFTGNHAGNSGANGNYCTLVKADNLLVDAITADQTFTGQQTYVAGNSTTSSSGGSAFLFIQGTGMTVRASMFKEAGYSNAVAIFDSVAFTLKDNLFDACNQIKMRGEVVKSSTGTVDGNTFQNGSYLDFLEVAGKAVSVVHNNFYGSTVASGVGVRIASTSTIAAAQSLTFSDNSFKDVVPFVSLISEASTGATGAKPQLSYESNNVYNPITGASDLWERFLVGGIANDRLTGAVTGAQGKTDFIIGGQGNDTITGNGGDDAFVFTATPGTKYNNVDTITDFNAYTKGTDKIWLDDSVFTRLTKGALGANFGTYINYDSATKTIYYDTAGTGSTTETTLSDTVLKVAILNGSSLSGLPIPTVVSTDFVVF